MTLSIAHLGPPGTNAETASLAYANWLTQEANCDCVLCPYPSISQTLQALVSGQTQLAVVPMENSIEGSVTITLDTLWQINTLRIQQALVLPISHALISLASHLEDIKTVYSHPQALAQCQGWLGKHLPQAQLIPANSTTEGLQFLKTDHTVAAISAPRASELYQLPILMQPINDYPDNYTRFWVCRDESNDNGLTEIFSRFQLIRTHTSLAFSVPANIPGSLMKPLQVLAEKDINMSRIESRPTKRSLGDYLFFIDIEADASHPFVQSALAELAAHTETLKIFGSYSVMSIPSP